MHCVSYDQGKPNSACKWHAVCHIPGKRKSFGKKKYLAIKIWHFQLLWLVEFCMIFKYGISLTFQLIIDKCFLSFSPFNEPEIFLFRALSLSKWNRVPGVWHSPCCIFRESQLSSKPWMHTTSVSFWGEDIGS